MTHEYALALAWITYASASRHLGDQMFSCGYDLPAHRIERGARAQSDAAGRAVAPSIATARWMHHALKGGIDRERLGAPMCDFNHLTVAATVLAVPAGGVAQAFLPEHQRGNTFHN